MIKKGLKLVLGCGIIVIENALTKNAIKNPAGFFIKPWLHLPGVFSFCTSGDVQVFQ